MMTGMKRVIGGFLLLFICIACNKDNDETIHFRNFHAKVYLDDPQYIGKTRFFVLPFQQFNDYVGIQGVVVYALVPGSIYHAFDLLCRHEHDKPGLFFVEGVDGDEMTMRCPECGSEFNIATEYGSVTKGPALRDLKKYQTEIRGSELHIWN